MADVTLGERELDVMAVLWEIESGTVEEVRQRLPAALAYNTVLTVLRNLEAKHLVGHVEEGRAYRYHARVAQHTAQQSAVRRLVDQFFSGSPEALVARLVESRTVSATELKKLAASLSRPRKKPKEGK